MCLCSLIFTRTPRKCWLLPCLSDRGDSEDPRGAVMSPGPSRKRDGCAVRPDLPDALTTVLCSLPAGGDLGWPPRVAHRSR